MTDKKYKPNPSNKAQVTAAARKALMAADPHYHAWPDEQQERFRATMDEDSCNTVRRVLLGSLLNIQCTNEKVSEAWESVPLSKLNRLNWARLLTSGIGEDYVYLNESLADGKSLLDFTTLYDYDYDDHLFQEDARRQHFDNYEAADYYGYRSSSWVRLMIDGDFSYSTFISLATHLKGEIEEAGDDIIEQLIPHKYIDGEDHGKPEKGGTLFDVKLDAGGQEGQLDELQSRWRSYLEERWLSMCKINAENPPAAYALERDWSGDPHCDFIFNNETSLKKIRWRHFLSDCKPLMQDYSAVERELEREVKKAKEFLTENHQDIQDNFDPNLIKFRKNRKVIFAPGALDDLDKINSDDDSEE